MEKIITIAQLAAAILLIALILMQKANTDAGGGLSAGSYDNAHVRRGGEKKLYQATIIVAIVFVAICIADLFI